MRLLLLSILLGAAAGPVLAAAPAPYAVAPSTASQNPIQKVIGGVANTAKEAGREVVSGARALSRTLRRAAIEIGSGVDSGKDVLDPFVPKGIDRLFAWDMRVVLRTEGVVLRGNYLDPPYFRKLSMEIRNRFDPYKKAGVGGTRDDVYKGLGLNIPEASRGWGVGLAGVKNDYWGLSLDWDKVASRGATDSTLDRRTALGGGYTPLGSNDGRRWNYTLTAGVNYEDVNSILKGVKSVKNGYGFSLGPVFQYGLDHIQVPGLSQLWLGDKVKLDRYKVRLIYSDSQIHPAAWALGADVTAYATKRVRFSAGVQETFLPGPDQGKFETKFGIAIIINFIDLKL